SRRRHTRFSRDWSSDVCSSDLGEVFDCALAEYLIWAGAKNENMFCDSAKMLTRSENDKELLKELGLIGLYNEIELPLSYVLFNRSEERRVGKECRYRWSRYRVK